MKALTHRLEASGGVALLSASTHPNAMRFRGVLVRLDEPSTKPPNGSDGHKIFLSSEVAKEKLSTLIGMGLNYAPSLDTHAQRRKVGTIQKAWIKGRDLWVSGVIWKHDFPEAEKDLKRDGLGMSMELGKVSVENIHADVWHLEDFYFLGATILKKDAAAYYKTMAIAAKADERSNSMQKKVVKKKVEEMTPEKIAAIAASAATAAVKKEFDPQFKSINRSLTSMATRIEEIDIAASGVNLNEEEIEINAGDEEVEVEACGKCGKEHGEEEACAMKASKKKDDDSDEDDEEDMDSEADEMESEGIDKGDLDEMGEGGEEGEENSEPGALNKGAKNVGNEGGTNRDVGPHKSMGVTGAAVAVLRKAVKQLTAQVKSLQAAAKENRELRQELNKLKKQTIKASHDINRRSLTPEIQGLLAKSSLDADDLRTSNQKLTATDIDAILANAGVDIPIVKRIELKNQFMRAGLMDEGRVERNNGAGR